MEPGQIIAVRALDGITRTHSSAGSSGSVQRKPHTGAERPESCDRSADRKGLVL